MPSSSRPSDDQRAMTHSYGAVVEWVRDGERFTDNRYSRAHRWLFDGGIEVRASSAPSSVPLPYSHADAVDPEEAYVAALSSCHMLFFLHLAAKAGYVVERYRDAATGAMAPNEDGRLFVATVTLAPAVEFGDGAKPDAAALAALHHAAHDGCYLANSVRTVITVVPSSPAA